MLNLFNAHALTSDWFILQTIFPMVQDILTVSMHPISLPAYFVDNISNGTRYNVPFKEHVLPSGLFCRLHFESNKKFWPFQRTCAHFRFNILNGAGNADPYIAPALISGLFCCQYFEWNRIHFRGTLFHFQFFKDLTRRTPIKNICEIWRIYMTHVVYNDDNDIVIVLSQ